MENDVVIQCAGVHKRFGKKVVLDGLDLDVHRGETVVLMGPSGTGKSVTLRHVVGLVRPDEGIVTVEGQDMATIGAEELSTLRKRMGYLFQEGALINWLSAGENVALPLRENTSLDADTIRSRVEEKLSLVRLEDVWDKMPSELSGGMRKRVGLARALITATGQLNRPAWPNLPGRDRFAGETFHSARWNHDVDLTGKTVAVIGTGASAIQFVPEIAKQAKQVLLFQRSAPYVIPKPDRPYSATEQRLMARFPLLQKLDRARVYTQNEARVLGFTSLQGAI